MKAIVNNVGKIILAENLLCKMNNQPKTTKTWINRIYKALDKSRILSRLYNDDAWQGVDDCLSVIEALGFEVNCWVQDGGYGDIDLNDHMPRSKTYEIRLTFDGIQPIRGYIKCMAAGTVDDPFDRYDLTVVLYPERKDMLKEEYLKRIVRNSIRQVIKESVDDFYNEEDFNGNVGQVGMVKSYDIGHYYTDQAELDAKENGYNSLEEYLKFYWSEIGGECPWTWQRLGSGYGYNGTTLAEIDGVRFKDIYGQIMVDEYPPKF